ncbi:hypothetical protein TRFO_16320 [Tritrichomonas foetus]|uniref:Uncharacterized protein n=1 Tax=Tritrichomonas foetus TaxID=1144522 RepID=A0A1J4KVC3_9EUKA|nr:hypothetical protein TRFO_16320 [Tritrichomonas foetus]|eukprot:OHT13461.1 hypothetical protein TRFO_16320 [Tritrichomonas foetus]
MCTLKKTHFSMLPHQARSTANQQYSTATRTQKQTIVIQKPSKKCKNLLAPLSPHPKDANPQNAQSQESLIEDNTNQQLQNTQNGEQLNNPNPPAPVAIQNQPAQPNNGNFDHFAEVKNRVNENMPQPLIQEFKVPKLANPKEKGVSMSVHPQSKVKFDGKKPRAPLSLQVLADRAALTGGNESFLPQLKVA